MKPLLLLDVDGVLCPFEAAYRTSMDLSFDGYEFVPGHCIHISQENTRRIRRLMDSFEIHWCTGWGDHANEIISPLHDLPSFPVVNIDMYSHNIHWKLDAIEAHVGDRPYAFVDDDISENGVHYANHRADTLWLPVRCNEGLTDSHVEKLELFAATLHNRVSNCA